MGRTRKRSRVPLSLFTALLGLALVACSSKPEPSAPVPTPDVWCEGLPPERCGESPEHCIRLTYCDGQPFCASRMNRPRDRTCGSVSVHGLGEPCCPGLVSRCGELTPDDTCEPQRDPTDMPSCLACGDGVCDVHEQRCNCPEDCAVTAKRPGIRYRGSEPEGPSGHRRTEGVTRPGQCLDALEKPDAVRHCLRQWVQALMGRRSARELRQAVDIEPFTRFDLELLECLDEDGEPAGARSRRALCLEALQRRTKDTRLRKLLSP
ncbi:hypothetical protein [Corallococcus sp. CA054B]|uniref:hypothetical protein n=1 Tax=Corallococcus sp. CA054B TaxID=2316734 RepID=UPI0011C351FA|nr:hypothetical protein [Corallococcus sp. CA054B]